VSAETRADASTENERWYLALTALWAAGVRAGGGGGPAHAPDADLRFAADVLPLSPGARVLDLACGWGRTTLALARQGYQVTGFDLSPELLALARERAAGAGLAIPFVQGTVRVLPDLGEFDAVTAFYDDSVLSFADEADNQAALRGVARLLRPGGAFLFGTTDCPRVVPPYQREERREHGLCIVEEIHFDAGTSTGTSIRTHHDPNGGMGTYRRVRRHYTPVEAASLLVGAGLVLEGAWCAYDDALPYGSRAEGMVLLARKQATGITPR
jgi:2-polyprenyl-3-methyl-5-hydroxy-6-metoxy-1,4-benzoquinol methylase